jgi:D-alanyl-D-alanine carboxypeptidase/D-alanyl-D-alanine-endopeptidase (penicillin-binding protein 4)
MIMHLFFKQNNPVHLIFFLFFPNNSIMLPRISLKSKISRDNYIQRLRVVFWGIVLSIIMFIGLYPDQSDMYHRYRIDFKGKIDTCLKNRLYNGVDLGIKIISLNGQQILYQYNREKPFIPASVTKILTSGITMALFGSDFTFETILMICGEPNNGILKGDIYIKGKGDPMLRREHLVKIARQLKRKSIKHIQGNIIYDTSYLDTEPPRYPPNARHLYAPPGALTLNYNWIPLKLEVGPPPKLKTIPQTAYARIWYDVEISPSQLPGKPSMTYIKEKWGDYFKIKGKITRWDRRYKILRLCVTRPGLFAASIFKECMQEEGITVTGRILRGTVPDKARVLESIRTEPMRHILQILNCESNNVIAELLNKNLGAVFDSIPGTRKKGLAVMNRYCCEKIGFRSGKFVLADASGLSPENRFSPDQLIKAMVHFYQNLGMDYCSTLAPQGHHPHAMNPVPPNNIRMFVKSGTLPATGVNTVAGYIFGDKKTGSFAFAIMANRRGAGPMSYSGTYTIPIMKAIIAVLKSNG